VQPTKSYGTRRLEVADGESKHCRLPFIPFFSTLSCQLGRDSADNINVVSESNQKLSSPCHLLTTRTALWCMMNSDTVVEGTVTLETLTATGWEEDDDQGAVDDWRKGLGTADGLMRTDNEFARTWWHENDWEDNEGRTRPVRVQSHASATFYFTDSHGLAFIVHPRWHGQHCQRREWLHYCR
jgi:hypothetical protein